MDTFDALREQDKNRQEWVKAARVFARLLDRVNDQTTIAWLSRDWDEAVEKPLAPASLAWKIVDDTREQLAQEAPLSLSEVAASMGELTTDDYLREMRAWQGARARREEEVADELFSGD